MAGNEITVSPPQWPENLLARAAHISLLALDVDGIMTDGSLLFSATGDELKAFNILDGLGLKQVMAAGVEVAVITGRRSPLTQRRMSSLGISTLLQGREDKLTACGKLPRTVSCPRHNLPIWAMTCRTWPPSVTPGWASPSPTGTGMYASTPTTVPGLPAVPGRSVS